MRRYFDSASWVVWWVLAVSALIVIAYGIIASPQSAAQAPKLCHAAMVIDRSGSVGTRNLQTIRNQILYLFQLQGLHNDKIQLAFWSFSSRSGVSGSNNYNAPFHDFVSSRDGDLNSDFKVRLEQMVHSGATNYEQGFGHDGFVLGRQAMNTRDGIDQIINKSNIVVFMTDGVPNEPGSSDNNTTARNAGRAAANKLKAAGKLIIGGIVGNTQQASLNYVINDGRTNDTTNTFRISTNYNDLSDKLKQVINDGCEDLFPQTPTDKYSLTPSVSTNDRIISGSAGITYSYSVTNREPGGSANTQWSIKRVLVDRGQSVNGLFSAETGGGQGYGCPEITALINGKGRCSDVVSGERTFASGSTLLDGEVPGATNPPVEDDWVVGTKVCYVLAIRKPTQNPSPTGRLAGSCSTVGKRPFVQVHGGDLWVGRKFAGDPIDEQGDAERAQIKTTTITKADGTTYGSWAEYGVFAPGTISGFASKSGLAGGSLSSVQETWNELTFANKDSKYGEFVEINSPHNTIPDATKAILANRPVTQNISDTKIKLEGKRGLYQKESGNLELEGSTIDKGATVVVHVPNGTVTIAGNMVYGGGEYRSLSELPQLIIIANKIDIKAEVTNVDAWLIAKGTDGTIRTCDTPGPLTSQICNEQLTINGPIMARDLQLRRTGPAVVGSNSSKEAMSAPAEIINLRADAYLWGQNNSRQDVRIRTTYTTELPPYF